VDIHETQQRQELLEKVRRLDREQHIQGVLSHIPNYFEKKKAYLERRERLKQKYPEEWESNEPKVVSALTLFEKQQKREKALNDFYHSIIKACEVIEKKQQECREQLSPK